MILEVDCRKAQIRLYTRSLIWAFTDQKCPEGRNFTIGAANIYNDT